jgi:hypothetical protein
LKPWDLGLEMRDSSCGTADANTIAASLMKLIKTPPPPLLRARFATVLDHLPSVPSVVLPIMSLVDTDQAHLLLNPIKKGCEYDWSSFRSI